MEEALLESVGQAAHPAVFLGLLSTGVPGVPVAEEVVLLAAAGVALYLSRATARRPA